jgi:hypothetical protein
MTFSIADHNVEGTLNLNKLIMAQDFKIEETIDLVQGVKKMVKGDAGTRKMLEEIHY